MANTIPTRLEIEAVAARIADYEAGYRDGLEAAAKHFEEKWEPSEPITFGAVVATIRALAADGEGE